jgi:DNA polymerase III subunit epsilon
MNLQLDRDLCFFDLEATGLSVVRDRIVQIGIVKYFKDGREPEEFSQLINPGIPISLEAMLVHGIQPKDVAKKPTFQQLAQKIYDFIGNADLAGYNSTRFDVPMLMEEFARVGMDFDVSKRRLVDVQRIFYKMEPRTLKAALKFYCNEDLKDAHDALADVKATIAVFEGQLARYEGVEYIDENNQKEEAPIKNDVQALHDFTNDTRFLDVTQKIRLDPNGEAVFTFGKHNGQLVGKTLHEDPGFHAWIQKMEFTAQVKQLCKQLLKDYEKNLKQG